MPSSPESASPLASDTPTDRFARPRATVLGAFVEGWRRVLGAPALTASMVLATLLLALPLAIALGGMLEEHLGASAEAERAAEGWHAGWAAEFGAQAQGLGRTFTHEILGFGGTLATLGGLLDREPLNPTLAGAAAAYVVLWIFVSGGLLDRLARARPVGVAAFFSACGAWFVRFLRLGVLVGAAYWALFAWLHPYLFATLYSRFTRDMTEERDAIVLRAALYAAFLVPVALVSVIADFAKVRAVVEDRRSMVSALLTAVRFVRRRFLRVAGLYLLNIVAALIVLRLWLQVAPAAGAPVWIAFLIGQLYLLVRIWAKLAFMASEVAFFQGELAHARYTAAPLPQWPASAAAEAINNLSVERRS
jgi:uncharacterized integral membrane protein